MDEQLVTEVQEIGLPSGHRYDGMCAVCEGPATFEVTTPWLRDGLICTACGTFPRNRRLTLALDHIGVDWRRGQLWEIAPFGATSDRLQRECAGYVGTHYWPDVPPGGERWGFTCQDVEAPTFADNTFDVVVSQDVFEHVFDWQRGMTQIARVLRPGGVHVWTVPRLRTLARTQTRARRVDGQVVYDAEAAYHGDPVADGSLVTSDWGLDLEELVRDAAGLDTISVRLESEHHGLLGTYSEVFVSRRP